MDSPPHYDTFFLGIDGGSSKTAGVLCDGAGAVLARCRKGPCAIPGRPKPESLAVLKSAIDELLSAAAVPPGAEWHCGIGVSGIDFPDEIPAQVKAVEEFLGLPPRRLTVVNDGIVALWGATCADRAAILQHGSGLTSVIRTAPGQERIFDALDVAHVFDMRMEAIRLVCRIIDGRCPPSPLKDRLLGVLQVANETQLAERIYRRQIAWPTIWSTLPTIFELWLEGDWAATSLVRRAVADYVLLAKALLAPIGNDADMIFGGGVMKPAPPRFWHLLAAELGRLAPGAVPKRPALPPEFGAAVMACHHAGGPARELFEQLKSQGAMPLRVREEGHVPTTPCPPAEDQASPGLRQA
jgi:N-acetylglucosamine kinase-like BadF-type ATPase